MSYLVLAGEYVYKANKPVHFDGSLARASLLPVSQLVISRILGASLRELRSLLARLGTSLPACVCSGQSAML
jgi:hypothetical protein